MLKKALLYGIGLFLIIGFSIFFIDVEISASSESEINSSTIKVMDEITDLEKFHKWDPRALTDSLITVEFIGEPGIGMKAITRGKDSLFVNEYEVISIEPLQSVQIVLRLAGGNELYYDFKLDSKGDQTTLNWSVTFDAPLFVKVVNVEDQLIESFQKGLTVLKNRLN